MIPLLIQYNTEPTTNSGQEKRQCRRYNYVNNVLPITPAGMTYRDCTTGRIIPTLFNYGDGVTVCAYSGSALVAIKGTITDVGGC